MAASTGSPASRRSTNCTPLTTRPSLTSRHGMTRTLNMLHYNFRASAFEPCMPEFSDYVIYADESGDHSLAHVDRTYPVFVLCLCLMRKSHYADKIVPGFQRFKFEWHGHDSIVLHERDI